MLRKIRIVAATICFTLITLLFLDFTGTLHLWFGWLAKIQFLPAVLALNVGVVAFLVILTLLFGRVYCSVICPLGVFQDIVSWISGKRKKEPIPLFTGYLMAALQHVGIVHRRPACRIHGYCGPHRSIQRIRTNRIQSVRSTLSMGKQFTRLLCRAYRQLCVLFHRRVAEKHTHFYHCPRHIRLVTYISMEKRAHLLQHDLPGGYCSGAIVPILSFPPRYRHDKM